MALRNAFENLATEAKQTTIISHVDGIEALLTTIDADTSILSVTGGGVETGALRVTIANNSTGVLSIDDNGGSLTVDGTVGVTGTFWQATQPVSGTFWQATQPVSIAASVAVTGPLTDAQLRASAVPVSIASVPSHAVTNAGTFAVQVTSAPTTAVTGTFWQATQPVSGTFWQATQPVSIASVPSHAVTNAGTFAVQVTSAPTTAVTGPLTDTQLRASAVPVSIASVPTHAVTQSGAWTVTTAANDVHDAAAGTSGQMSVGYASATAPTAVGAADAARLWTTLNGALNIADGGSTISIDDGAGAITVDGTVSISGTVPVSIASMPSTPVTGTFYQATQPVSLASVPSHAVTNAGTFAVQVTSAPTTAVTGTFWQATQPVSIASAIGITDNSGSLTIDAPVATPAFVRLSNGSAAVDTLPVSIASVPSHAVTNAGTFAVQVTSAPTTAVTGTFWQATQPVSGPLTDTQLRATAVPVSIASVPSHAVTNAGTFATQESGAALTALQLIDDIIISDNTAIGTTKMAMVGGFDGTNSQYMSVNSSGYINIAAPDFATSNTVLGSLNANCTLGIQGKQTIGVTIRSISSPVGLTLTPYISYDGGTNWTPTVFSNHTTYNKETSLTNASLVVGASREIVVAGGVSHVKVELTSWTSGTITVYIITSNAQTITTLFTGGVDTTSRPGSIAQVGGWDGSNLRSFSLNNSGHINIADGGNSITVDGTFWQATQPVSIATLPTLATVTTVGTVTTCNLASDDTHDGAAGTSVVMAGGYAYGYADSDNSPPTISANADAARFLTNKNGGQVVVHLPESCQAYAPTNVTTTAYAASLIIKASAGTLYMVTGYSNKTDTQFIQIHDSATLPADTAVPKVIFSVPPLGNFSYDLGNYGRYFANGIVICNSSTGPTKTIGSADCWIDAQFK